MPRTRPRTSSATSSTETSPPSPPRARSPTPTRLSCPSRTSPRTAASESWVTPPAPPLLTTGFFSDTNSLGQIVAPESQVIAGLQQAVNEGVNVVSESYGFGALPGANDDLLEPTNDAMVQAGVVVVESAGDSGSSGTVEAPADDPNVIDAARDERPQAPRPGRWLHQGLGKRQHDDLVVGRHRSQWRRGGPGRPRLPGARCRRRRPGTAASDRGLWRHQPVGPVHLRRRRRRDPGLPRHPRRCHPDASPGEGDPHQHGHRHRG